MYCYVIYVFSEIHPPTYLNSRQNEASPLEILQNCITSIGISGQKQRTKTHGNST